MAFRTGELSEDCGCVTCCVLRVCDGRCLGGCHWKSVCTACTANGVWGSFTFCIGIYSLPLSLVQMDKQTNRNEHKKGDTVQLQKGILSFFTSALKTQQVLNDSSVTVYPPLNIASLQTHTHGRKRHLHQRGMVGMTKMRKYILNLIFIEE